MFRPEGHLKDEIMKIIATIANNDPTVERRVGLGITRDGYGYAIISDEGEDAGQYRWASQDEALKAIADLWGSAEWDLQWEI